jgi:toxin ParE1/3/4
MSHRVVFAPEAQEQLADLYHYIAAAASADIAAHYTEAILNYCESLSSFPLRGTVRHDIRPGLRITHYRRRAVIAFTADTQQVSILGIFYGGRDYESVLQEGADDDAAH